jgi:hypothetical protein
MSKKRRFEDEGKQDVEEEDESDDGYLNYVLGIIDIFLHDEFENVKQVRDKARSIRSDILKQFKKEESEPEAPKIQFEMRHVPEIPMIPPNLIMPPIDLGLTVSEPSLGLVIPPLDLGLTVPLVNLGLTVPESTPNIWDYKLPTDKPSIPTCHCNLDAVEKQVIKLNENKGRHFWTCELQKCSFFQWLD